MVAPSFLKSFQALEAALRSGSLKGAAEALSVTPAAVGQRVKSLEDYLGIDLLVRGRSGLAPTSVLVGAMEHLSAAFRELEAAADALELQRGHEIHIAAVSDFAELWLKPRLSRFRDAHPNIRFCVNGEGDAPLRLGTMDCEVNFGALSEKEQVDRLFADFVLPISSPENTQRISKLSKRERLEGFPLLHLDFYKNDPAVPGWKAWAEANRIQRTAPERGIRFQRITAALEAVLADAGLAICGLALIVDLAEKKRLSLPFPTATGAWTTHYFYAHFRKDALARPQVRKLREWFLAEAALTERRLANFLERQQHRRR